MLKAILFLTVSGSISIAYASPGTINKIKCETSNGSLTLSESGSQLGFSSASLTIVKNDGDIETNHREVYTDKVKNLQSGTFSYERSSDGVTDTISLSVSREDDKKRVSIQKLSKGTNGVLSQTSMYVNCK